MEERQLVHFITYKMRLFYENLKNALMILLKHCWYREQILKVRIGFSSKHKAENRINAAEVGIVLTDFQILFTRSFTAQYEAVFSLLFISLYFLFMFSEPKF